ncbi:peptidase C65 Otubain-domain-containing protein [Suillus discolor]|uniref:ubiquitinyl hydrolase 1 n=1 Tax=Suillus discolor TaxID=1912936 RepID=A0A9P7F7N3_9AGAM|nr:peptidase C65 Otubain-domain-containing protein [Suillus discolor]KAG2107718.1 peptidase C65 Otubain-domain-containing protein [Suillus discolor]
MNNQSSSSTSPGSPLRPRDADVPEAEGAQFKSSNFPGTAKLSEELDTYDGAHRSQFYELGQKLLEESMGRDRPLISPPTTIHELRAEYTGAPSFVAQIDSLLNRGYTKIIRTKGDGNCFYRALAYAYLSSLVDSPNLVYAAKSVIESGSRMMERNFMDADIISTFCEPLMDLVDAIGNPDPNKVLTHGRLLSAFLEDETSNCIVTYLRLLTTAQIQSASDDYAGFLFDDSGEQLEPTEFCRQYVDPLGKEADHVQVAALCRALKLHIRIAYLDGHSPDGQAHFQDITPPDGENNKSLTLIYRPGHYDVLIKTN